MTDPSPLPEHAGLDGLGGGAAVLDCAGVVCAANAAWRAFEAIEGGVPRKEAVGGNYLAACERAAADGDAHAAAFAAGIRAVLAGARRFDLVYPCRSSGRLCWFEARVRAFADGASGAALVIHEEIAGTGQGPEAAPIPEQRREMDDTVAGPRGSAERSGATGDLAARDVAARALEASEARFRSLFEHAPIGLTLVALDGSILAANRAVQRILGYDEDDFRRMTFVDFTHPDDIEADWTLFQEVLAGTRDSYTLDKRYLRRDGQDVWGHLAVSATRDGSGAARSIIGMLLDVTERHQAEERLRQSEAQYRRIVETAEEGIWQIDADARTTFVNRKMAEMLGCDVATMPGRSLYEFVDSDTAEDIAMRIARRWQGVSADADVAYRRQDGSHFWAHIAANPLFDGEGRYAGALAMVSDVTERRLAAETWARLAAIVDYSDDAITGTTLDGVLESWNAGAERLYGYRAEEVIGRSVSLLIPPGLPDTMQSSLVRLRRGEPVVLAEALRRHKDGRLIDVCLTISPIEDGSGTIVAAASIAREITAQKEAQRQLEQARDAAEDLARMRSDFVASVSHELRTPLTAIVGYAELLEARWPHLEDAQRLDWIERIVGSANRQLRLIENLLTLTEYGFGGGEPVAEDIALHAQVERAAAEVQGSYPGQFIEQIGSATLRVHADKDRVLQIVAQLLDNAAKYSPEGSPVSVEWHAADGMGVVRVRDRGAGIEEAGRAALFTRFGRIRGSRIRAGHVGTGLGLYIGRQLAEAMGGELVLESTGPDGSVFRLRLPLARSSPG